MQSKKMLIFFLMFSLAGCKGSFLPDTIEKKDNKKEVKKMGEIIEICRNKEDIVKMNGKKVIVSGIYRQVDVRQRRKPPPVYTGHVSITLEDSTEVLIEPVWKKEAIRSSDEIKRLENQKVSIKGIIHVFAPESPDGAANLLMPCITQVESIEIVE